MLPNITGSFLTLALFLNSCSASETAERAAEIKTDGRFIVTGTMRFLNIEGGCWFLETPDGRHFEPGGEDLHRILVEGLVVGLEVRTIPGVRSTCQTGTPVEVLRIMNIEQEK